MFACLTTDIVTLYIRRERSVYDSSYDKLSEQLETAAAEVSAVVGSIEVAQTAERHALAETEVLKAQGDSEQVNRAACPHVNLLLVDHKFNTAACQYVPIDCLP